MSQCGLCDDCVDAGPIDSGINIARRTQQPCYLPAADSKRVYHWLRAPDAEAHSGGCDAWSLLRLAHQALANQQPLTGLRCSCVTPLQQITAFTAHACTLHHCYLRGHRPLPSGLELMHTLQHVNAASVASCMASAQPFVVWCRAG